MLISLDNNKPIDYIPHSKEFNIWKSRLTNEEYANLVAEITLLLDTKKIITSSFLPGSDWTGTPYQIIYEKACSEDFEQSAHFFGLLVWDAVTKHKEAWSFMKAANIKSLSELNIKGMTYFRVDTDKVKELHFNG